MRTDDVLALREEVGWVSPIRPLEPGDPPWCVFDVPGFVEVMVHPDDAFRYLSVGYPAPDVPRKCSVVGVWPLVNAIQLHVHLNAHEHGMYGLPGSPRSREAA